MTTFATATEDPTFRNPADISAIGVCYLAQTGLVGTVTVAVGVDERHPRGAKCQWCSYPPSMLLTYIREFFMWADTFIGTKTVEDWRRLKPNAQRDAVNASLGIEA